MKKLPGLINFAILTGFVVMPALFAACKGRTAENMVPTGDTIEVVINRPDNPQDTLQQQIQTDIE